MPDTTGGSPAGTSGKEPTCQSRRHKRHRFDPWVGKIPWGGNGNPPQYFCLENSMDRGAWQVAALGAAKSHTRLKWLSMHSAPAELSALFMIEWSWLPHSLAPSNSAAIWYFFNSVELGDHLQSCYFSFCCAW